MLRWELSIAFIFVVSVIASTLTSRADDLAVMHTPGAASRDAHRDRRLPAVLPGEVVEVAPGQRIKVWSSSGPVPVAPNVPQPPNNSQLNHLPAFAPGVGGVIVDQRHHGDRGVRYSDPINQQR
jgi:hypothetical protein